MTPIDVYEYYDGDLNFHHKTKMARNSVRNWIKWGYIPYVSQKKLERLTNGKLVAVWEHSEPTKRTSDEMDIAYHQAMIDIKKRKLKSSKETR